MPQIKEPIGRSFPQQQIHSQVVVVPLICALLSLFGTSCSERPMGAREEMALRLVQGYSLGDGYFSVSSNIGQKERNAGLSGNAWSQKTWEAGLQSQTDRIVDTLSQYFNVFEAPGGRLVRLQYTDSSGLHEAIWDVDIYSKRAVPKDDLAKEFTTPEDVQRAQLPDHLTGPGTWAGGN